MRRPMKHDAPGVRRDHGRLRHFSYVKPLRRKRRKSIGRRDPGIRGAPKRVGDHGFTTGLREIELPCGGTKFKFCGRPLPARTTKAQRRMARPITDKRHFAGVKAADTRLLNQVRGLLARLERTLRRQSRVLPAGWDTRRAIEELRAVHDWANGYFGWEDT